MSDRTVGENLMIADTSHDLFNDNINGHIYDPIVREYDQCVSIRFETQGKTCVKLSCPHYNKEGQCFPYIKTIAKECGYSVNTVKRALDDLVKAGFVTKEARFDTGRKHGGQTSNLYTLNIVEPKKDEQQQSNDVYTSEKEA